MKTTIDLPEALVKQAKQKALHEGRPFKDLVADCIRRGLHDLPPRSLGGASAVLDITPEGLPLFRGDGSPGFREPALADVLRLEQASLEQEDLARAGLSD